MNKEPLWTVAGITAAVVAIITLITAFGVDITGEQREAIIGVVAVAAPLMVAIVARRKVYSQATVDQLAEEAVIVDPIAEDIGPEDVFAEEDLEDVEDDLYLEEDPLLGEVVDGRG